MPDSMMLHCSEKSSLMRIPEKLCGESQQRTDAAPWNSVDDKMNLDAERLSQLRVGAADTMTKLQFLADKPDDNKLGQV